MISRRVLKKCPIFGNVSCSIPLHMLPSEAYVIKDVVRIKMETSNGTSHQLAFMEVAGSVTRIWKQAFLPVIDEDSVSRKIRTLFAKYRKLMKSSTSKYFESMKSSFKNKHEKLLFDICRCKCDDIYACKCPYQHKVPNREKHFLIDQRTSRKLRFANINVEELKKYYDRKTNKAIVRKTKKASSKAKLETQLTTRAARALKRRATRTFVSQAKKAKLANTVLTLDRFALSDRGAASVLNAFQKDLGLLNDENLYDKNSIRRRKANVRKQVVAQRKSDLHTFIRDRRCFGLFFDGKKDSTNSTTLDDETKTYRPRKDKKEHYTMIIEPENKFYCHVTSEGSGSEAIYDSIITRVLEDDIDTTKLAFIGSDATNTNTGKFEGTFSLYNNRLYLHY